VFYLTLTTFSFHPCYLLNVKQQQEQINARTLRMLSGTHL